VNRRGGAIVPRVHEFSIAQNIVSAVLAELKKAQPARLKRVHVVVGRQHQIVPDNLIFAYKALIKETPAAGSALKLRAVPIAAQCRKCRWQGEIHGALFVCGACSSGELEITGGQELYLESLEIERDEKTKN
jgi:hydrogenase nickel incorporation protein HypA/HybF